MPPTPRDRWQQENAAAPARLEPPTTVSSVPIDALYTPADLGAFDPESDLGYPGQYPFTRGVHASMYRSRLWTMRQFAGFGTPQQTNERFRFLLAKGQTGLSTAFDLPTLMGLDSDDPRLLSARSAGSASPSIRSTTWSSFSAASTWPGSPCP